MNSSMEDLFLDHFDALTSAGMIVVYRHREERATAPDAPTYTVMAITKIGLHGGLAVTRLFRCSEDGRKELHQFLRVGLRDDRCWNRLSPLMQRRLIESKLFPQGITRANMDVRPDDDFTLYCSNEIGRFLS